MSARAPARPTSRSADTLTATGLATPFVVLFFLSIWGLPLIAALVAGHIVVSQRHSPPATSSSSAGTSPASDDPEPAGAGRSRHARPNLLLIGRRAVTRAESVVAEPVIPGARLNAT